MSNARQQGAKSCITVLRSLNLLFNALVMLIFVLSLDTLMTNFKFLALFLWVQSFSLSFTLNVLSSSLKLWFGPSQFLFARLTKCNTSLQSCITDDWF